MKRLLLIFLFLPYISLAQTVSNVTSRQNGNLIEINYSVKNISSNQLVKVNLYYSLNSSNYIGPLQKVTGDVGDYISGNGNKKITWDVLSEIGSLEGETKFKVEIIPKENFEFPSSNGIDLSGKILNCSTKGSILTIDLEIISEVDRNWFFDSTKAAFFDVNGIKYFGSSLKIGNNSNKESDRIELMKGIPIRIQYIFSNVPENLTKLVGLDIRYHYNDFSLQYRDVPVIKK